MCACSCPCCVLKLTMQLRFTIKAGSNYGTPVDHRGCPSPTLVLHRATLAVGDARWWTMSDRNFKVVELDSIKMEDGAKELMSAPEMQPYLRYIEAAMLGGDVDPSLQEIAELPLEKRYVWRVASALKMGFADFEDWNVVVDRKTL